MAFRHDTSLVFPAMKQVNLDTGRVYVVQEGPYTGKWFPSITRVIRATPKPELEAWKKRVGPEEAERARQKGANRGNPLHNIAEAYLKNEPLPPVSHIVREEWVRLKAWIDQHITCVYKQEQDVFSGRLGVAGRLDLLAAVDGEIAVVDFKNARRAKEEAWIQDYLVQGTFYTLAVYECTGVPVRRITVPILNPDGMQIFDVLPKNYFDKLMKYIDFFYASYEKETSLTPEAVAV